jgi:signal peptidase I
MDDDRSQAPATAAAPRAPNPWVAALLSLLCVGLGQMRCGRMRRGLALFLSVVLAGSAASVLPVVTVPSRPALLALVGVVATGLALFLASILDAALLARRMRRRGLPVGQRPGPVLAVLFVAVSLSALPHAALARDTTCQAFRIPTASMSPTVVPGDRVLVDKTTPWQVRRGDVVVYRDAEHADRFNIKRVVGVAGDRVEWTGSEMRVNGDALPRSPAGAAEDDVYWEENAGTRYRVLHEEGIAAGVPETIVPAESVYVVGDNRGMSRDSRLDGPVPLSRVVGRVIYLVWPAESWARFGVLQ